MPKENWSEGLLLTPEKEVLARLILEEVRMGEDVLKAIRHHPVPTGGHVAKSILVAAYRQGVARGDWEEDPALLMSIRMKPVRSLSGLTTVTVLCEPHPCPGDCIFCPDDERMPKSYLPDEPGAARAFQNQFDPHKQVISRLESYAAVGHPTDKIELLILGGTWDAYPHNYQEWFVKRCFDAMNGNEADDLQEAQRLNENSAHRNVGLVVETRPDTITPQELAWLRRLGVTKVQMGAQSMDDSILTMNKRGHTTAATVRAAALLRAYAFKIVLHWMPNLLGATPASDRADFPRIWELVCPDEIKIYPTQLLDNSQLYTYWLKGEYHPYSTEELVDLIADLKPSIPPYCRVNRIIRDIPSKHVIEGNRRTSLRLDVAAKLSARGQSCRCIRCREIRGQAVSTETLRFDDLIYHPACAEEHFLSFITPDDRIAGYLRLSLPGYGWENRCAYEGEEIPVAVDEELKNAALVREVHVYGQALSIGGEQSGAAQHIGLGTALLQKAEGIARERGYSHLAVIAAVGTRLYYEVRGFHRGELYMTKAL
jgi:elongator complex protein 3